LVEEPKSTNASIEEKKENGHVVVSGSSGLANGTTKVAIPDKPVLKSPTKSTLKLTDLLKGKPSNDPGTATTEVKIEANESFTPEQLKLIWNDFAEQRKKLQAEYQLLIQPFEIRGTQVVVQLLSTVQETLLGNFKSDLTTYLRENLKNNSITIIGELREAEEKQMLYTPRDKFEYLLGKNPILKELKDRLGLDADF
jgi:hypothetical protein